MSLLIQIKKKLFNTETIFHLTTQKKTPFANKHNFTPSQDLKLFTTTQTIVKNKQLIQIDHDKF